jgi:asparagine synthase (glutamine-hydrolysing)
VTIRSYWDLSFEGGRTWSSIDEAGEALDDLLRRTVKSHMISDVPVGFLTSGGVDSTALLSYAVAETSNPIQTFTVGFSGRVVDERPYARLAAERYETCHHELTISSHDFGEFLPQYVWHMEEPVCEPPAVALYYISQLARQHVKVLLSGEGGDEAFGGYPEYRNYLVFERIKKWSRVLRPLSQLVLNSRAEGPQIRRLRKYTALSDLPIADYYFSRVTTPIDYFNSRKSWLYADPFAASVKRSDATEPTKALFRQTAGQHLLNRMLYVDIKTWLPDDLLLKADKMTMATSLELRVPFLDHKVLEFAAALPPVFKVRGRSTKRILKRVFARRIPAEIIGRRKAGFPVPYDTWLRTDLRDMVSDILLSSAAMSRGYFRREALETATQPDGPQSAPARELFSLLTLELWHRQFATATPSVH